MYIHANNLLYFFAECKHSYTHFSECYLCYDMTQALKGHKTKQ